MVEREGVRERGGRDREKQNRYRDRKRQREEGGLGRMIRWVDRSIHREH